MASGEYGTSDVLRLVTTMGLRTRTGRPLSLQSFGAILRNRVYAGYMNSPALAIRDVRGDFEPLVSESLFQRVQLVLKGG